jgi:ABC-type Fe3+ transport system substrate-binding protein
MTGTIWTAAVLGAVLLTGQAPAPIRVITNVEVERVRRALGQFGRASASPAIDIEAVDARELKNRLADRARPIDILLIEGIEYLDDAFSAGLIARFESASMRESIPYAFRSRSGGWFAVSYVARGVVSPTGAAMPDRLANVWSVPISARDALCLPPAKQVRGRAAVADAVRDFGGRAEAVVGQWVARATPSAPRSELESIRLVAAGRCTIGIAYSDAIAEVRMGSPQLRFNVSWPRGTGPGASILATGIARTTRSQNYDLVLRLLDWMASDEGQRAWTTSTLTFPASQFVRPPEPVAALGPVPVDLSSLNTPTALLMAAEQIAARAGYR